MLDLAYKAEREVIFFCELCARVIAKLDLAESRR